MNTLTGHDSRLSAKFCESEMMSKGNVESLLARCVNDEENITDSSFRLWRRLVKVRKPVPTRNLLRRVKGFLFSNSNCSIQQKVIL